LLTITELSPQELGRTYRVTPGADALSLQAFAPAVSRSVTSLPQSQPLSLTAYAPSVVIDVRRVPGTGILTITEQPAQLIYSVGIVITPGTGQLLILSSRDIFTKIQGQVLTPGVPLRLKDASIVTVHSVDNRFVYYMQEINGRFQMVRENRAHLAYDINGWYVQDAVTTITSGPLLSGPDRKVVIL
jgi:hypothetical protein